MAAGPKRVLVANVLLVISSSVGVVLLLEFGARTLGLRTPLYLGPAKYNCLQRSALLDVEFRPGCTGSTFNTPVRTNAVGLRGPEVRDDGSTRILALGDSCTWGWQVGEGESYPAQLQLLLDQQAPGRYQVLNAGQPGSTSYHGLLYLRERGLALQPAVVIAGYGFNDMTTDGDVETQLARAHRAMPFVLLDDLLLQRSTAYRWVRLNLDAGTRRLDRPPRVPPDRYERNFREMIQLARRHGAGFVLLDLTHAAKERAYPEALAAVSRELSVPLVVYEGPRVDLVHPTSDGYRMLAARLRPLL